MNQKIKIIKDACPKCNSQDLIVEPAEYDDGTTSDDLKDARCSSCGFEYMIVDV